MSIRDLTDHRDFPFVSVVVPAYNEATMLSMCLQSLRDQTYKGPIELVVVDNGSSDLTPKIAKLFGAKVISESRRGVAFARQAGFSQASGDIICSTDADTVVPPDWVSRIVGEFKDRPELVAVGGRFDLVGIDSLVKMVVDFLLPTAFAFDWLITRGGSLYGVNFGVRKTAFASIGGFKTDLLASEDVDLSVRLKRRGKVKISADLTVKTSSRRFDTGLAAILRYEIINYLSSVFRGRPNLRLTEIVREKAFDAYGRGVRLPRLAWVGAALVVGLFSIGSGAFPFINIESVSHVNTREQLIALTFDDGPNEPDTNQVLEVLQAKGVKATFFLIGKNVVQEPDVVLEIYHQGHTVANHSFSHHRRLMAGRPQLLLTDVNRAGSEICRIIGKTPRFFRPPYGYRTVWGDWLLVRNGYTIVTWNDMTADYRNMDPGKIAAEIVKKAKPGGIIVLHDGSEKAQPANQNNTVEAVPEVIDALRSEGFRFVTVDELLGQEPYFSDCVGNR